MRANRKRKLVLDAVNGRPAVDMDGRKMRALMVDRAPLLTRRGWQGPAPADSELLPSLAMPVNGAAQQHGEQVRRPLEHPAVLVAAAPKLVGLFEGMVRLLGVAEGGSPAKVRLCRIVHAFHCFC